MQTFLGLVAAFGLSIPAFATSKKLELVHYGWISEHNGRQAVYHKEFRLGLGDTTREDQRANTPMRISMGPFGMNAAAYFRNPDGTWNLFNFRLPDEYLLEQAANREHEGFIEFMRRPDVAAVMEAPYEKVDFGRPGDFIYKRMRIGTAELPEPFRRFPAGVLDVLEMIMIYNADGTGKAYFKQPFDREETAESLFRQISI